MHEDATIAHPLSPAGALQPSLQPVQRPSTVRHSTNRLRCRHEVTACLVANLSSTLNLTSSTAAEVACCTAAQSQQAHTLTRPATPRPNTADSCAEKQTLHAARFLGCIRMQLLRTLSPTLSVMRSVTCSHDANARAVKCCRTQEQPLMRRLRVREQDAVSSKVEATHACSGTTAGA
jgi:hypothetical protein